MNRRFALLTEEEAHESRTARRPEGSRAARDSMPRAGTATPTIGVLHLRRNGTWLSLFRHRRQCRQQPRDATTVPVAAWRCPLGKNHQGACATVADADPFEVIWDAAHARRSSAAMAHTPTRACHAAHPPAETETATAGAGGLARSWSCPDASGISRAGASDASAAGMAGRGLPKVRGAHAPRLARRDAPFRGNPAKTASR